MASPSFSDVFSRSLCSVRRTPLASSVNVDSIDDMKSKSPIAEKTLPTSVSTPVQKSSFRRTTASPLRKPRRPGATRSTIAAPVSATVSTASAPMSTAALAALDTQAGRIDVSSSSRR